jgi:hypothetical protein
MSLTQERLRDILTEYKTWIDNVTLLIDSALTREATGRSNPAIAYTALLAEIESLRSLPRMRFVVEWHELNKNWKRNQRNAEVARQKRRKRGVPERKASEGIRGDYVARGRLSLSPQQLAEEEEYLRFNAENAYVPEGKPKPAKQERDSPDMDIIRCQYELGLADAPSEEQLAKWRERKGLGAHEGAQHD